MSVKHILGLISCLGICCMDVFALEIQEDVVIPVENFSDESVELETCLPDECIRTLVEDNISSYDAVRTLMSVSMYEKNLQDLTECNVSNSKDCKSYKKTYMYFTSVTNKSTEQYKLLNSDECYTDAKTGIRKVGNRYCIALGTGYCDKIGTRIDLVMEDGSVIKCILSEIKSDRHTDKETHTYHVGGYENGIYYEGDGSVAEFIVDKDVFLSVREDKSGTVNWVDGFEGSIQKVVIIPDDAVLTEDLE